MRPNGEELVRGAQASLLTYVLPEVRSAYARQELMLVVALLGIAADGWDDAAQRLIDDNATLRTLLLRAADELDDGTLGGELRRLASEENATARVSELTATNGRLRDALGRAGVAAQGELREAILAYLREEAERRDRSLLGPRSDG